MNRQSSPHLAAKPMDTVRGTLAIAARLCVATVGAAVLDAETRLVWKRTPDATLRNGGDASRHCSLYKSDANSANRRGWVYSDAGRTSTFRTWCVHGAG
jgi:hypothetical protein